jgi:hypothetical protein
MASLTACGGDTGSAAKSNSDLLKEAVANMKAAKTYHINADLTSSGQPVKMDGDIDQGSKSYKLNMSAAGQSIDMIQVGTDSYLSMDGGKTYTKSPAGGAADFSGFTGMWDTINPADIDKAKDALKDGSPATEQIDGTDTKHMTGNAKDLSTLAGSTGDTAQDGTIDIWVTTGDKPTVRQMKITSTDTNGTLKWTKIDEPVTITAPPTSLKLDGVLALVQPAFAGAR